MENIYLVFVIVLFLLAISDLVVGVSNDAVNFLNSAIGSKAASFKVVMFVAALGVLIGAAFSGGMMEIARSGIFHPDKFYFTDIMMIFLAVMITDVILLDTFNTLGLPTSTTVSIVFELLGASVAITIMKISNSSDPQQINEYINSGKALAIISGILLSVVIAFSVGALVQYFTRALFSFNYNKRLRYFGGIYGGLALTAIVYFMVIKGAKDAVFMSKDMLEWIKGHTAIILSGSFVAFSFLLYFFNLVFRVNILKIIVLVGTFALAMAFAGNDLVNFIGVPLAGYESFKTLLATPGADPEFFQMSSLKNAIQTPPLFLLLAGAIMVLTLYTSRKARSVIKTSVDLSRQDVGEERFGSSQLSRSIVRLALNLSDSLGKFLPNKIKHTFARQFEPLTHDKYDKNLPAFDLLRASVNLVVASALIAMGTSLKLPLSTTYVTFMVAMGTSLSDGAWDRESAVYRITGVFSVIGGWFFTAFSAFMVSFLIALLFFYGGYYAVGVMILIAVILVIRTHKIHLRNEHTKENAARELDEFNAEDILTSCSRTVTDLLNQTQLEYKRTITAMSEESIKSLKKIKKSIEKLTQNAKDKKNNVTIVINKLKDDSIESGHFYVQALDYAREILHSLNFIVVPIFNHVDNNHKPLGTAQISELKNLSQHIGNFFAHISTDITENNFKSQDEIAADQLKILALIDLFRKNEVKRIKKDATSTRNSLLFMNVLQETKNLLLFSFNLYKAQRDFLTYHESKKTKEK
ncbi:MAG: phosphate permease [Bacteroidetes bacterium HGW-Bacteroidetes-1]|nr:MAG: phosphate permease [Bacteroidetes bacterium HGW-Bacteroidetes-1]